MKAHDTTVMILAAGRGQRMRPLTDHTPKPLLKVGQHSLIEHHLIRLQQLGFRHIIINLAYLGEQIIEQLGNGERYQLTINYSDESNSGALETAGGIANATPLIQSDNFIVINADVWTDFDYRHLLKHTSEQATLVMVNNPAHNLAGDFAIDRKGLVKECPRNEKLVDGFNCYTFSGIAYYPKSLFTKLPKIKLALLPVLKNQIKNDSLYAIVHNGVWHDIGTIDRLEELRATQKN